MIDFTITNIQHIEEVGILVDIHIQGEVTLANGTLMHQFIQLNIPVNGDEATTLGEIRQEARQQALQALQEAVDFLR